MNIPPEYHGPHARRWTDPDTGRTYSLKPSDYVAVAGAHQLQQEQRHRDWEAERKDWVAAVTASPQLTEAEYLSNIHGTHYDEATIRNTLKEIDTILHKREQKNAQADASVEVVPMMVREPERLAHFVVEEDGSFDLIVSCLPRSVSAREVVERGRGQDEGVMNWLGARRWIRPAAYGAVLVYIIFIIGVTAVSMGGQ